MTCRDFTDYLDEHLSDEVPAARRAELEQHRRACANCDAYLDTYAATIRLARAAYSEPDVAASAELPETLVQTILAAMPRGNRST